MRLHVFGPDAGIGGALRTLAMLVDGDVLVEAGSGLGELSFDALAQIDHVFISHSHMDHIACLPMLVDAVAPMRKSPLTVHAAEETVKSLREHIFNWKVWPDYTRIPSPDRPGMRYSVVALGEAVELGGRRITPLPAQHSVPTVGFLLDSGRASLAYSADTTTCDALWRELNRVANLRYVIVETSFEDARQDLTAPAGHLCPTLLASELEKLEQPAEIFVAHRKTGVGDVIMREITEQVSRHRVRALERDQVLEF